MNKNFYFEGIKENQEKTSGVISAKNKRLAQAYLATQSIQCIQLKRHYGLWRFSKKQTTFTLRPKQVTHFFHQLTILLQANIPLCQALKTLAESASSEKIKQGLLQIQKALTEGHSFFETLKNYPKIFNSITCTLIHIGEETGRLPILLEHLVQYRQKMENLQRKLFQALWYPLMVISIMIIVMGVLCGFIMPQFAALFNQMQVPLPMITQGVLFAANLFKMAALPCLIFLGLLLFLFQQIKKRVPWIQKRSDQAILACPLFGHLIQNLLLSRIFRTLAITLGAGISLLEALQLTQSAVHFISFQIALKNIKGNLRAGQMLQEAITNTPLFPPLVRQMIILGEETGQLEAIFIQLANLYENIANNMIQYLTQLLEPIIISIIGCVVGVLIIAMYLPLFKLGTVLS